MWPSTIKLLRWKLFRTRSLDSTVPVSFDPAGGWGVRDYKYKRPKNINANYIWRIFVFMSLTICIIQYNNQWECMSIKSPYDGNCVAFWFYVGAYQSVSNNAFHQISKFSEGWSLSLAKLILSLPVRFCFNRCFVHLALNGENQHNPIQFISWSHNERLNRNVWTYYTLYINNMVCWISPVPH